MRTSPPYWEQTATVRWLVGQKLLKRASSPYFPEFYETDEELISDYNRCDCFRDRFKLLWFRIKGTDTYHSVTQHPYTPSEDLAIGTYVSPCGNYSAKVTKL
ncbi:hypothetical protein MicvaDRAFT_0089 [Microcoleus vaginatus FGP-2]|nr:hypothetical protein MicvaDRAFT_0089 [Microcoleus vaginatus FGP-2]